MNTVNKKILKHIVALRLEYVEKYISEKIIQRRFLDNPDNNQFLNDLLCIAFLESREFWEKETYKMMPIETEKSIAHTEQRLGITLPQDLKDAYLEFGCPYFFMNTLSSDNSLYGDSLKSRIFRNREWVSPLVDYLASAYYYEDIDKFYTDRFDNDIEFIQKLNQRFIAFGLFFEAGEKFLLMLWDIELQKYALLPFYENDQKTLNNLLKSEYSVYDTFEVLIFNLKPAYEKK